MRFATRVYIRFASLLLVSLAAGRLPAAHPIMLEGRFEDWAQVESLYEDAAGDAVPGGVDFLEFFVTNDGFHLFMSFEVADEMLNQEDNSMALYLDGDDDVATGLEIGGIGADLVWHFGGRYGVYYGTSHDTVGWHLAGIVVGPGYSSTRFELALDRLVRPDGMTPLFQGNRVAFFFQDGAPGGDRAPDSGRSMHYTFDDSDPLIPEPILLEKESSADIRLLTYNVLWDNLWDEEERCRRILGSIEPDIVAFQEIFSHTAEQTAQWMSRLLPGPWYAERMGADLVLVSRFEFIGNWQPGTEYASAHLLAIPFRTDSLLLVINLHLPWGGNDIGRQQAIDAIMAFVRDAESPGDQLDLPEGTPIVITGDTNMYGDIQQIETMLNGDISDNATYGPDFMPDWGDSPLEELISRQPNRRLGYTWYNEANSYLPTHIDRITYTGSTMEIGNHYVLHTPLLDQQLLDLFGLQQDDTRIASDHLPHVADLRFSPLKASSAFSNHRTLRISPNPSSAGTEVCLWLPPQSHEVQLYDLAGRLVFSLLECGGRDFVRTRIPSPSGTFLIRCLSVSGTSAIPMIITK